MAIGKITRFLSEGQRAGWAEGRLGAYGLSAETGAMPYSIFTGF